MKWITKDGLAHYALIPVLILHVALGVYTESKLLAQRPIPSYLM